MLNILYYKNRTERYLIIIRFGVPSQKLSNIGQRWVTKNLLSQAPPCFGRHVKPFRASEGTLSRIIVSTLSHRMTDQNLLSRGPPRFEKHVKPLVPVASVVVSTQSNFKES
jgi:hypothetical protein